MEKITYIQINTMMIRKGDKRQYCDKYHQVEIINGSQINSQLGERAIMTYSMRI